MLGKSSGINGWTMMDLYLDFPKGTLAFPDLGYFNKIPNSRQGFHGFPTCFLTWGTSKTCFKKNSARIRCLPGLANSLDLHHVVLHVSPPKSETGPN